ncbi:uncharacterized protein At5g01610-like isoform X2 [Prosopis cineraria]|uniref:uncharacterized protein At5g01610-like isoform X2 n=1 Tax=Prosopis cineraria TaxID=364024 RepID=UPI00240EDCDB|nr:uncharacterized protein At5g01610-like isoform X2 [Prosopis cineraria]
MEKALTTVGSFWISKKAKQEFSNISNDLSSLSNSVEGMAKCLLNKLTGKQRKEIGEVLREHNIPGGMFPSNIKCYEFDESKGKLTVHLAYPCEVCFKDSSLLRYSTRVKASLSRGKLTVLDGMKTKLLVWVKVSSVCVESYKSDKVCFTVSGGVKISRPRDAYDLPRPAIQVHDF